MIIEQNVGTEVAEAIASHPILLKLISGSETFKEYKADLKTNYCVGIHEDRIIGMISLKPITNKMLECHAYVYPEYWGTGLGEQLALEVENQVIRKSPFNILQATAPGKCKEVQQFLIRFGFEEKCRYKDALEYLGDITDMIYYEKRLTDG